MPTVDVAFSPNQIGDGDAYVVIDLFRATTNIVTLFSSGLARLTVAENIAAARELAKGKTTLLLGEEGGLPPDGFDHGNSPIESAGLELANSEAILATTNGSAAICAAAALGPTYIGALANLEAVCREVSSRDRVTLVCSGDDYGRSFSLEDFSTAGALTLRLKELTSNVELSDSARLAALAWETGGAEFLLRSVHAERLRRIGLDQDLEFAVRRNTADVAPMVVASGPGWARLEA